MLVYQRVKLPIFSGVFPSTAPLWAAVLSAPLAPGWRRGSWAQSHTCNEARARRMKSTYLLIWSYLSISNYFLPNLSYSELFLDLLICPFSSVYSYPSFSLSLSLSLSPLREFSHRLKASQTSSPPETVCLIYLFVIIYYYVLFLSMDCYLFLGILIYSYLFLSHPI